VISHGASGLLRIDITKCDNTVSSTVVGVCQVTITPGPPKTFLGTIKNPAPAAADFFKKSRLEFLAFDIISAIV
jgi:hypothetical protein